MKFQKGNKINLGKHHTKETNLELNNYIKLCQTKK